MTSVVDRAQTRSDQSTGGPTVKETLLRAGALIPYGMGTRILAFAYARKWIRSTVFAPKLGSVRALLALAPGPTYDGEVQRRSLAANLFTSWRFIALTRTAEADFGRWVEIRGAERLQNIYASKGRVIVVNSHFGVSRCVPLALYRMGHAVCSVEATNHWARMGVREAQRITVLEVGHKKNALREVYLAKRALEEGRVLHIVADGYFGDSGVTVPFCGRSRRFATGFAEMAIMTGASLVPAFGTIDAGGRICIEFLVELDAGAPDRSRDERVKGLVEQYASLLETRWHDDPGNVKWGSIRRFQALPSVASGPE